MRNIWFLLCLFLLTSCTDTSNVSTLTSNVSSSNISDFLIRIGGEKAAMKLELVVDESLSANGKDVFVITSKNEKPCIKANSILAIVNTKYYVKAYATNSAGTVYSDVASFTTLASTPVVNTVGSSAYDSPPKFAPTWHVAQPNSLNSS